MRQAFQAMLIFLIVYTISATTAAPPLITLISFISVLGAAIVWLAHIVAFSSKVTLVNKRRLLEAEMEEFQSNKMSRRKYLLGFSKSLIASVIVTVVPRFAQGLISPAIAAAGPCTCHLPSGATLDVYAITCNGRCYGNCPSGYICELIANDSGAGWYCGCYHPH
jgi:hypothetical protein